MEKSLTSELAEDLVKANLEQTEETTEEVVEETESTETEVETEVEQDDDVITEELAKEFGVSETFIGKPKSELAKAYREAQKSVTQTKQAISELKRTNEKLQDQQQEIKEETGIDVTKLPDPLDDPEGFKDAMVKLSKGNAVDVDALRKQVKEELMAELEPEIAPAKELAIKNKTNEVVQSVQAGLPKGEDAKKVVELWAADQKEMLEMYKNAGWSPYGVKPGLMVKDILKFFKSTAYDDLKKTHKKVVDKEVENRLKKRSEVEPPVKNTSERTEEEKPSIMSEIASDLMVKAGVTAKQ